MTADPHPTTEQVRAAQQLDRRAAARRYAVAVTAVAHHNAHFLAMKEAGAGPAALLEFLGQCEQARKSLAEAKAACINAAWADGALTNEERLGEAVDGLLRSAAG